MFDIQAVSPLMPGKPERGVYCVAWYWQRPVWWTDFIGGWARCDGQAKRYRAVDGNIEPVCGIHARAHKVLVRKPVR